MKSYVILLIVLVVAAAIGYIYLNDSHGSSNLKIIQVNGISEINSVQDMGNGKLLLSGAYLDGNQIVGVVGTYYLSNHSFVPLPINLTNGSVYDACFNGTTFGIAGAQYVNTTLQVRILLYSNGKLYNLTPLISDFYQVGQAYFAQPYENGWLFGGTSFTIGINQRGLQYPFLILYNGTIKDLTPNLPQPFRPLGVADTLDTLSVSGNQFLVGGGNLNATLASYDGQFENLSLGIPGVILASSPIPGGWLVGGTIFGDQGGNQLIYTYLATINASGVRQVNLSYQLGLVTAVAYGGGEYAVALRVPFNSPTSTPREGAVLLVGHSLHLLKEVYEQANASITDLEISHGVLYASGYSTLSGNRQAFLLVYS